MSDPPDYLGAALLPPAAIDGGASPLAERARDLYRRRRLRDGIFGADSKLFGEPAWDMLLDLFHWQEERRSICLSSCCIASGSPTTTAMRYIRRLELSALVVRERDARDGRRWWIRLTIEGDRLVRKFLLSDLAEEGASATPGSRHRHSRNRDGAS